MDRRRLPVDDAPDRYPHRRRARHPRQRRRRRYAATPLRRYRNPSLTSLVYARWHDLERADGGEPDRQEGGDAATGAGDDHATQADALSEQAAGERAEGERAPDDGPHGGADASLQTQRGNGLTEAELVDVVGWNGQPDEPLSCRHHGGGLQRHAPGGNQQQLARDRGQNAEQDGPS